MTGNINFETYFQKYEGLVTLVDQVFERVRAENGDLVKCRTGCSDCCHALFDLTLIEAIYLNQKFNLRFDKKQKEEILERANRADRKIYKIKRAAHKSLLKGENEVAILAEVGGERVRCPLLDKKEMCVLYENRPLTCRIYGIPTAIQGMSHTCGKSGFIEGGRYPTVSMDAIYKKLYEISAEMVASLKTRYIKMGDMLVPVSMALLTEYNEEYLGLVDPEKEKGADKSE